MSSIVQSIHKVNKPSRSHFDLSANINFSTTTGMLLPVRVDDCLPGSTYKYQLSTFARTVPLAVPSFARVKAHFDAFFVPYRILGQDYQAIIVGDNRGIARNYASGTYSESNYSLPYISPAALFPFSANGVDSEQPNFGALADAAGISYNISSPILFNALGYGVDSFGTTPVIASTSRESIATNGAIVSSHATDFSATTLHRNILPLQAYQKIYQDFYRNKLWEKENKASYYCFSQDDGTDMTAAGRTNGLFEMRYHDYDKDRIIGMIPDENQILSYGITEYASSLLNGKNGIDSPAVLGSSSVPASNVAIVNTAGTPSSLFVLNYNNQSPSFVSKGLFAPGDNVVNQQYSALTMRRLEAFQKFAEITSMNKSDYKHQIEAHFGITVPSLDSDYVQYIGGYDMPLNISDVENTNLSDGPSRLAGKGTFNGNSNTFEVSPKEHGLVMIICYVLPEIDWSNCFINRNTLRFNRYDFAIPEFDNLGFEPIRLIDVVGENKVTKANPYDPSAIIGYLPRYWYYKTALDTNTTGFSSPNQSELNFNAYVVNYDYNRIIDNFKKGTMYKAFKSLPSDLEGAFPNFWSSVTDNYFIFTTYINCRASLPLSVDGLPY